MSPEWFPIIQRALRARKRSVPLNRTWLAVHAEYGVGIRSGSKLDLSEDDLAKLHAAAERLAGTNPLALDLAQSRIDQSKHTAQDKLSSRPVFRMLRVAATDGVIEVRSDNGAIVHFPSMPGTFIGMRGAQLVIDPARFDRVIIIENGSAMERWWDIPPILPERYRTRSLLVYRGHGQDAAALLSTLSALPDAVDVLFFGDFDPSGVDIALGIDKHLIHRRIALLAPTMPERLAKSMTKPETYEKQNQCLQRLLGLSLSEELNELLGLIKRDGWAVTQEILIAHGVPLTVYPLQKQTL